MPKGPSKIASRGLLASPLRAADRNGRWHRCGDLKPGPVDKLLREIEADPTRIFWG